MRRRAAEQETTGRTPLPPTPVFAEVAEPLEYEPPPAPRPARSRLGTLAGGLLISVMYSFSGGMIAFGLMLGLRDAREAPAFVAAGVAGAILATGVWITVWLARRR